MGAWPIEEAFVVRPLGSVGLAALTPWLIDLVAARVVGEAGLDRARAVLRPVLTALAFALGATALGPSLAPTEGGLASHAAGFLCASIAILVCTRRGGPVDWRRLSIGFGGAVLFGVAMALFAAPWGVALTSLVVLVAGGIGFRPQRPPTAEASLGYGVGGGLSLLLMALFALPIPMTAIVLEEAPQHGDATWRLRIYPWDENAMLASGWAARRRGQLDRAEASAHVAVRMGLSEGPALELESEVWAARGECETAQRTFDRALRARAREAFSGDSSLLAPLVLGGYQLPPTLLTTCGGIERLPGLGDLTPP